MTDIKLTDRWEARVLDDVVILNWYGGNYKPVLTSSMYIPKVVFDLLIREYKSLGDSTSVESNGIPGPESRYEDSSPLYTGLASGTKVRTEDGVPCTVIHDYKGQCDHHRCNFRCCVLLEYKDPDTGSAVYKLNRERSSLEVIDG